ncbi:MAG: type II secretion system protein [Phycisphaerales bacterium]|nr:type II secretion system protein [Phycisphaerales bacterium]
MRTQSTTARYPGARPAFSIVELLVVFFIIGMVLSILVPAISGVRQSARKASTSALMKDLQTASNQFSADRNGTTPGYFSPQQMGSRDNRDRGFTAMQNVLLDLAGGVVSNGTRNLSDPCSDAGAIIEVGPEAGADKVVRVSLNAIGSPTKDLSRGTDVRAYFNPAQSGFVKFCTTESRATNVDDHRALPELVDAWGNPILAWQRDDRGGASSAFAAEDSQTVARFYWNSNAGILNARAVGRSLRDHNQYAAGGLYSLIGGGAMSSSPQNVVGNSGNSGALAALLGNPAFPVPGNPSPAQPASARGGLVFHSAGIDGWFLSSEDKGARAVQQQLRYTPIDDPISLFDDVVISVLN